MSKDATVRKGLVIPAKLAQEVDDYRFENRFRTDAEVLRFLIEAGLKAEMARIDHANAELETQKAGSGAMVGAFPVTGFPTRTHRKDEQ